MSRGLQIGESKWRAILALPPACSVVASLSIIWTLGPLGDWLIEHWLPVTRWFWEVTLGRIEWLDLMPEQKDMLTFGTLLFPIYFVSRRKPIIPGVAMNRLRLLAFVIIILIAAIIARGIVYDAGSFVSGGFRAVWETFLAITAVSTFFLAMMVVFIAYAGLEKLIVMGPSAYRDPQTSTPLGRTSWAILVVLAVLTLAFATVHLVVRVFDIWNGHFLLERAYHGAALYLPTHPLFPLLVIPVLLIAARVLGSKRPAWKPPRTAKARKGSTQKPRAKGNNDNSALWLYGPLLAVGGAQAVGWQTSIILVIFSIMIGVTAIRNPRRLIDIGWSIAFILMCAGLLSAFEKTQAWLAAQPLPAT